MSAFGIIAGITGGLKAGAGIFGVDAETNAARSNARLKRASAHAQAQISRYQNELNYKVAMAQSQQSANNAKVLHQYARSQEVQGFEQINRSYQQEEMVASAVEAQYGASGIAADTGSPLMVEAHNAGMAQLARMDSAYKTNLSALDTDWKGKMETYQSQVQAEMAKQYQYGMQMADWEGGAMANAAYNNAMTAANNAQISGYLDVATSLLSDGMGMMKPSTAKATR
jgi:hypothetical protein